MTATASAMQMGQMINTRNIGNDKAKREAAQRLQKAIMGGVRYLVLYAKSSRIGDSVMGRHYGYNGQEYTLERLAETHGLVAYVDISRTGDDTGNLDSIFLSMQGENWSPNGEARDMIELAGVNHTSMMTGDVVYDTYTGIAWECGEIGWHIMLPEGLRRMLREELAN